jgi:hypothetical protein
MKRQYLAAALNVAIGTRQKVLTMCHLGLAHK